MAGLSLIEKAKQKANIEGLRRCGLVDAEWYNTVYPDVREAGADPTTHYVNHGAAEGRDPSADFSTKAYLEANPDVYETGSNPLLHFAKLGARQGRKTFRSTIVDPNWQPVDPVRDRAANAKGAALAPQSVQTSATALAAFREKLPAPGDHDGDARRVPKLLHFIYGFIGPGEFPYYAYLAIKSALHFNPGWTAYFYFMHEPHGVYWDKIRTLITPVKIDDFDYLGNARFQHYAHKADAIRLLALQKSGGVYLDIDTITQKSYESLRRFEFTMGVQAAGPDSASGLCNAVMVACPGAKFVDTWISEYDYFRSTGRDDLWDYHSVKLPVRLAATMPDTIQVLDYRAFFYPLWYAIEHFLFKDVSHDLKPDFASAYCFHLWNGASGDFLESLSPEFVTTSKSIYAEIARDVEGRAG